MLSRTIAFVLGFALLQAGCRQAGAPASVAGAQEIAWRQGDVDDAFAEAKQLGKPVILYWGADWCPPCAQMKSTLFKDPAFIKETQDFVPVYLDGDTQGAQRWAERFQISGYPTVIVLRADGTEITRIANTTMASELPALLKAAASRTTSIEALLKKASADTGSLNAQDWRILAGFDWRNDPKHFGDLKAGPLLSRLAQGAPEAALKRRFALLSLIESIKPSQQGPVAMTAAQQAELLAILRPMLASPAEVVANRWELISDVPNFVASLPPGPDKDALEKSMLAAADAIFANEKLALVERVDALNIDLTFAFANGKVPPALAAKVHERAAWADRMAKDKMTRQSVINSVAGMLGASGDGAAAARMITKEMGRSDQPYYYMSTIATFAEYGGDKKGAVEWARKAYEASQGPATRVKFAAEYADTVLRLTPEDKGAVEKAAGAVIAELGRTPDSYYQNTRKKVAALGNELRTWSKSHGGADVLKRLQARMAQACARQGTQAGTCSKWAQA